MKAFILLFSLLLCLVGFSSSASGDIDWYYWSPLAVEETITPLDGGIFLYEYAFTNVDTSPIWNFGVYTSFQTHGVEKFDGHSQWSGPHINSTSMEDTIPEYDARNLSANILHLSITGYQAGISGNPIYAIQLGENTSGFSFTANVYDPLPKYYFYETISSGFTLTNGTGKVAAVGTTVPEPLTILMLGTGFLLARRKNRSLSCLLFISIV